MASSGQGGKPSGSMGVVEGGGFLILASMLFIFGTLWYLKHDAIVRFFLFYAWCILWIPAKISAMIGWTNSFPYRLISDISVLSRNTRLVDNPEILFIIVNKASYFLLPLLFFLPLYAKTAHQSIFKQLEKLYEHWELMKVQSLTNPSILHVVRFTEYWAEHKIDRPNAIFRALNPDEFAEKHDLVMINGQQHEMNPEKTREVFINQIGPILNVKKIQDYKKALMVIFMTRIVYRGKEGRDKARRMLDNIERSCNPEKAYKNKNAPDFSKAFDFSDCVSKFDELYRHPTIANIRLYFIHETTFTMRLLSEARIDGKLPPAEFNWLKLVDRGFFYALYGVSKTLIAKGYSEGGGPFGQYWAAVTAMENGQILEKPYVEETLRGFEKRLFEANILSERKMMTERERKMLEEFGRIPDV